MKIVYLRVWIIDEFVGVGVKPVVKTSLKMSLQFCRKNDINVNN